MKLRGGEIIHKGLKTTLYEMRTMGRDGWRRLCPWPAYFIVSRESGKLSYHWKPAFTVAASGPDRGAVTNPDTGRTIPAADGGTITRAGFGAVKLSERYTRGKEGTSGFSALWQRMARPTKHNCSGYDNLYRAGYLCPPLY